MKSGKPYVMFGDGTLASCKPISEADLARFMADCVQDSDKINQTLPIGGAMMSSILSLTQVHIRQRIPVLLPTDAAMLLHSVSHPCLCTSLHECTTAIKTTRCSQVVLETWSVCVGPGKAWSAREQGQYLFELAGRKPNFIQVPVALMDGIIGFLDLLAKVFPGLEVRQT